MKTISDPTILEKLQGLEPLYLLEVDWTSTLTGKYSDRAYLHYDPRIIVISNFAITTKASNISIAGSISVQLSDDDGVLKNIINTIDIHKLTCRVYQGFKNQPNSKRILLFTGVIISPIIWNETPRYLEFSIEQKVEDKEVGFSPEQGDFATLAPESVGKLWPICFGSCINVPAVKITGTARGKAITKYHLLTVKDIDDLEVTQTQFNEALRQKVIADEHMGSYTIEEYSKILEDTAKKYTDSLMQAQYLGAEDPNKLYEINQFVHGVGEAEYYTNLIREQNQDLTITRRKYRKSLNRIRKLKKRIIALTIEFYNSATVNEINTSIHNIYLFSRFIKYQDKPSFDAWVKGLGQILEKSKDQGTITISNIRWQDFEKYNPIAQYADGAEWIRLLIEIISPNTKSLYERGIVKMPWNDVWDETEKLADEITNKNKLEKEITEIVKKINVLTVEAAPYIDLYNVYRSYLVKFNITEIEVEDASSFPTSNIDIIVNGIRFNGSFTGNIFNIKRSLIPNEKDIPIVEYGDLSMNQFYLEENSPYNLKDKYCLIGGEDTAYTRVVYVTNQENRVCTYQTILWVPVVDFAGAITKYDTLMPGTYISKILETCPVLPYRWLQTIQDLELTDIVAGLDGMPDKTWEINPGDNIYLANEFEEVYVANYIPGSTIIEVSGIREYGGNTERRMTIPSDYFTIDENYSVAGKVVTAIKFKQPLEYYTLDKWRDNVYVTLKNTTPGSNTSDIIKWIIENFTDLTVNTASFNQVKALIANYPSHFPILKQENVLKCIEEIAWQARCCILIQNNIVYLKYLPYQESSVKTITGNNILDGSLVIKYSETESIITKLKAKWKRDHYLKENTFVLRNNVTKYGLVEDEVDMYIYNVEQLVAKSVLYWLIHKSNTWKIIEFKSFIDTLALDIFDTVLLNVSGSYFSTGSIIGRVISISYDPNTLLFTYNIWIPIRAGEMTQYKWAYPNSAADVTYGDGS